MSFRVCNKGGEGGFRWEGGEEEGAGLKVNKYSYSIFHMLIFIFLAKKFFDIPSRILLKA